MQMLPEEINFIQDSRDCEFDPGCSYHVIFKYEDKAERFRRNITIPGEAVLYRRPSRLCY